MTDRMEWPRLLCADRYGEARPDPDDGRTPAERDVSRLLFANAFRRLHNKTQVFPLPANDHVHSRLTHSLEVADVGRSLARLVAPTIRQRHELPASSDEALAGIVQAACLAHDLGNPPFGHAGEDAIGHFFAAGRGRDWIAGCDPARQDDLKYFEGNAQGFRLLANTSMYKGAGGMRLTAATLAAFMKYPQGSPGRGRRERIGGKKFGFFQSEADCFRWVAERCGLLPVTDVTGGAWQRHPAAYLMEAADDICYHILDLEDGVMLKLVPKQTMVTACAPILDRSEAQLAEREPAALRGAAIGVLVQQTAAAFLAHEDAMLAGDYQRNLTDDIPAAPYLQAIFDTINMPLCYRSTVALDLEQTGYNVIDGLLTNLCESLFDGRNRRLIRTLPDGEPQGDTYQKALAITDYVSGMTDRYALRRYRAWTGIDIHSV